MSLDEIRKSIDAEARKSADSIKKEGEGEADAVLKAARSRAAEILKAAKSDAEREAERIRGEQISGTRMEASSMVVAAKEAVLERHMDQLRKSIALQLAAKRLDRVIAGAAKQFARFSPKGSMVVRTGKAHAALVKKLGYEALQGKEGELSVESRDGSVSIDASPHGLARMHAPEARALLAAKLWKVKD